MKKKSIVKKKKHDEIALSTKTNLDRIKGLKLVIMLEYRNIKTFLQGYIPNWSEYVFVIKEVKNTVPLTHIVSDLNDEEIDGTLQKKNFKRQSKKKLELKK